MRKIALVSVVFTIITALLLIKDSSSIDFTKEEIAYIQNTAVTWSAEYNYTPFVYTDDGKPEGLSVDYLNLISEKSGLKFVPILPGCQLDACLENVANGKADLTTSVRPTPQRAETLKFSRPYYIIGTVFIKRVFEPATVGVGKGYAVIEYLKLNRPDLQLVETDSDETSIELLIAGKIDSVILDSTSAALLRKKYSLNFDQVEIPHDYPLSFATKKDNQLLVSILDKTISKITDNERQKINKKWE